MLLCNNVQVCGTDSDASGGVNDLYPMGTRYLRMHTA